MVEAATSLPTIPPHHTQPGATSSTQTDKTSSRPGSSTEHLKSVEKEEKKIVTRFLSCRSVEDVRKWAEIKKLRAGCTVGYSAIGVISYIPIWHMGKYEPIMSETSLKNYKAAQAKYDIIFHLPNHWSDADPGPLAEGIYFLCKDRSEISFFFKAELLKQWLAGTLLPLSGGIAVERDSLPQNATTEKKAEHRVEVVRKIANTIKSRIQDSGMKRFVLYPEGRTSPYRDPAKMLREAKTGSLEAIFLAIQELGIDPSKVALLPAGMDHQKAKGKCKVEFGEAISLKNAMDDIAARKQNTETQDPDIKTINENTETQDQNTQTETQDIKPYNKRVQSYADEVLMPEISKLCGHPLETQEELKTRKEGEKEKRKTREAEKLALAQAKAAQSATNTWSRLLNRAIAIGSPTAATVLIAIAAALAHRTNAMSTTET